MKILKNLLGVLCITFFIVIFVFSFGCSRIEVRNQHSPVWSVDGNVNGGNGCRKEKIYKDRVGIVIKAEYKEQFLNKQFEISDLNWKNANIIEYGFWSEYSDASKDKGYLIIYLKRSGRLHINAAVKHFQTLDFVSEGYFISNYIDIDDNRYLDRVKVVIKPEYKESFINRAFSVETFNWSNVDYIEYNNWMENDDKLKEEGFMTVYLKRHGKNEIEKAVKHFQTLDFVLQTDFIYYMTIC